MKRRDFIKYTTMGGAALWLGSRLPWMGPRPAHAATVTSLNITITDAIKEMVTHNQINDARCYFWLYQVTATLPGGAVVDIPADCPGPTLFATQGDQIQITITNNLDEPHNLAIPEFGYNSGSIPADGAPHVAPTLTVGAPGTYLYYDTLNAPVNRVMGLHGALVSMPAVKSGTKWTPYSAAQVTFQVQALFNDLGTGHWPGLAWEEGNAATLTPPFRHYIWLLHQASPPLFAEVGNFTPGADFPAAQFVNRFLGSAANQTFNTHEDNPPSDVPQYFTGGGQSGHFEHNNPVLTLMARAGEPCVLSVLNAGLMSHSMHIHANHFYILSVDGVVQGLPDPSDPTLTKPGVIWVDTWTANYWEAPSHRYDVLLPFHRPPDVHNARGIGRADAPLPTQNGGTTWPPLEEFGLAFGKKIPVRQSPLCYPAHDHSEPSQTSQGGNYNCGVIGGVYFIGDLNISLPTFENPFLDRNLPPQTFPMDEDFAMMIFRNDGTIVYGIDEARTQGIMEASRDSGLESQADRETTDIF